MANEENEPNPCLVAFLFPLPITKWHAVIRPQINPPEFPAPIHSSKFWRSESQPHSIKDDDSCEMICWIFHWISGGGGEQSRKSSFRLEILPWITERKRIKRLLRRNILPPGGPSQHGSFCSYTTHRSRERISSYITCFPPSSRHLLFHLGNSTPFYTLAFIPPKCIPLVWSGCCYSHQIMDGKTWQVNVFSYGNRIIGVALHCWAVSGKHSPKMQTMEAGVVVREIHDEYNLNWLLGKFHFIIPQ